MMEVERVYFKVPPVHDLGCSSKEHINDLYPTHISIFTGVYKGQVINSNPEVLRKSKARE